MEELKTLAADQNKSTEERRKLLEQATEKLHAIRDMEVQILEAKYKQIKAQNELGYTSDEDARKEQEALAALEQARANYATQEKEIYGQLTGYEKADAAAKQANIKAALDARRKAAEDAEKAEVEAAQSAQLHHRHEGTRVRAVGDRRESQGPWQIRVRPSIQRGGSA